MHSYSSTISRKILISVYFITVGGKRALEHLVLNKTKKSGNERNETVFCFLALQRVIMDTNPYLLAFSGVFMALHTLFSFFAFKNGTTEHRWCIVTSPYSLKHLSCIDFRYPILAPQRVYAGPVCSHNRFQLFVRSCNCFILVRFRGNVVFDSV